MIRHLIAVLWEAHRVQRAMVLWTAARKARKPQPKVIQRGLLDICKALALPPLKRCKLRKMLRAKNNPR